MGMYCGNSLHEIPLRADWETRWAELPSGHCFWCVLMLATGLSNRALSCNACSWTHQSAQGCYTGEISRTLSGLRLQARQERVWLGCQTPGHGLTSALECVHGGERNQIPELEPICPRTRHLTLTYKFKRNAM